MTNLARSDNARTKAQLRSNPYAFGGLLAVSNRLLPILQLLQRILVLWVPLRPLPVISSKQRTSPPFVIRNRV